VTSAEAGQKSCWGKLKHTHRLGNIVPGVFTPVLAKHSKSFSLIDCISVGVDRMQRNFEPMRKQVKAWVVAEFSHYQIFRRPDVVLHARQFL
jgi:hypothetical protein